MLVERPFPGPHGRAERAAVHAALGEPLRLAIVEALILSDRSPAELASWLGIGTNLLSHHLAVLRDAGLIERRSSQGDGRRAYIRLCPESLEGIVGIPTIRASRILFVCTRNAARSPIAAALWRRVSGVPASSAGPTPAARTDPGAIEAASRHGLDLGPHEPRRYEDVREHPDLIVSVCDRAAEAPIPFEAPRVHWSVPDPASSEVPSAYEDAYRDLEARVARLAPLVVS